jgi:hypothetical protein
MVKFKLWDFKHKLDDYFFESLNIAMKTVFFIKNLIGKYAYMKKNIELKDKYKGQRGFLVANGPSLKKQDLKLLKDEVTFFVNRAFLHEDYEYIQPTFHVIVDGKLATGEWDISFLDQILLKNPNVIFILNSNWYYLEKFQPYIEDERFKIYWVDMKLFFTPFFKNRKIDITKISYGIAVTGIAKMIMLYMGMRNIYFLGNDGNGLCYEILGVDSHFYGKNPENNLKSIDNIASDLHTMSVSLKSWINFSNYCKDISVSIVNVTEGGIFNMFERKKYEDILNEK